MVLFLLMVFFQWKNLSVLAFKVFNDNIQSKLQIVCKKNIYKFDIHTLIELIWDVFPALCKKITKEIRKKWTTIAQTLPVFC